MLRGETEKNDIRCHYARLRSQYFCCSISVLYSLITPFCVTESMVI